MKRIVLNGILVAVPLVLAAQEPQEQTGGKRQPPSASVDVLQERTRENQTLPKIDLPEFVITGTASINPPDVEKQIVEEDGRYVRNQIESTPGARDRATVDLGERFKESLSNSKEGFNGSIRASMGNYFTPNLWGAFGMMEPSYDAIVRAHYSRTAGFMKNTDVSTGGLGVEGSTIIASEPGMFNRSRIRASASYDVEKYRFYGSAAPTTLRDVSTFGFRFHALSAVESPFVFSGDLTYQTLGVRDSTSETRENLLTVRADGTVAVFEYPIELGGRVSLGTVRTASPNNLFLVSLTVGIPRFFWNDLFADLSMTGYVIKGMEGQEGSYFYPNVFAGYRFSSVHTMFFGFTPKIRFLTFWDEIQQNPYISANARFRHPNVRLEISAGVESDWTSWLSTKISVLHQQITDYPLYADSANIGMWLLAYGGKTEMTTAQLDIVANITSNDYFAFAVKARSTKNSILGGRIPYVPGFEGSAVYRHRFSFDLQVISSVSIAGSRESNVVSSETVGSCVWTGLRAEYGIVPSLTMFLNLENILDTTYEVWKGYRARPFQLAFGLSYRW